MCKLLKVSHKSSNFVRFDQNKPYARSGENSFSPAEALCEIPARSRYRYNNTNTRQKDFCLRIKVRFSGSGSTVSNNSQTQIVFSTPCVTGYDLLRAEWKETPQKNVQFLRFFRYISHSKVKENTVNFGKIRVLSVTRGSKKPQLNHLCHCELFW